MRFEELQKRLKKGQIQACIMSENDRVIFEYYKNKKSRDTLHPIHSCTKSIVSMLTGLCLRDKLISDVNTPISEYLTDYSSVFKDPQKASLTIYHLLTMTPGFDWPEFSDWNFGSPMEFSKDIVKFVLERDIITQPGTQMNYNSGCSNLLSYIIQNCTGMKLIDYADQSLFSKLGINDVVWHEKQGINLGSNGLKIKAEDMQKLAQLYLHMGKYNEKQIIPENWVPESTKPYFRTYESIGYYGYHWWSDVIHLDQTEISYYFALGLFGQYMIVVPDYKFTAVFVSDNYSETMKPMICFRDCIGEILGLN